MKQLILELQQTRKKLHEVGSKYRGLLPSPIVTIIETSLIMFDSTIQYLQEHPDAEKGEVDIADWKGYHGDEIISMDP